MRKIPLVASLALVIFTVTGCAATKETLTDLERAALKSRAIDGTRDAAFSATLAALQNADYIVKESDAATGEIRAETERSALGFGSEQYTATVRLETIAENKVRIRLSISRATFDPAGREVPAFPPMDNEFVMGTPVHKAGPIDEPKRYVDLYLAIEKKLGIKKEAQDATPT